MIRFRSDPLLCAARDQACVLCGDDQGTTVAAHLPGAKYGMGAGTGQKTHDWLVAHLCHQCHEKMDAEWRNDYRMRLGALCLTLERLFEQGVITVKR